LAWLEAFLFLPMMLIILFFFFVFFSRRSFLSCCCGFRPLFPPFPINDATFFLQPFGTVLLSIRIIDSRPLSLFFFPPRLRRHGIPFSFFPFLPSDAVPPLASEEPFPPFSPPDGKGTSLFFFFLAPGDFSPARKFLPPLFFPLPGRGSLPSFFPLSLVFRPWDFSWMLSFFSSFFARRFFFLFRRRTPFFPASLDVAFSYADRGFFFFVPFFFFSTGHRFFFSFCRRTPAFLFFFPTRERLLFFFLPPFFVRFLQKKPFFFLVRKVFFFSLNHWHFPCRACFLPFREKAPSLATSPFMPHNYFAEERSSPPFPTSFRKIVLSSRVNVPPSFPPLFGQTVLLRARGFSLFRGNPSPQLQLGLSGTTLAETLFFFFPGVPGAPGARLRLSFSEDISFPFCFVSAFSSIFIFFCSFLPPLFLREQPPCRAGFFFPFFF